MNLLRGLPNEEPASGDQDHIAPGEAVAEDPDDRFSELHDEENHAQEGQPQNERSADAHPARCRALMLRKLVG
jgi:hypothetical protein